MPSTDPRERQDSSTPKLMREVTDWKLEAKFENNAQYFFHVNEVRRIANGSDWFVIGRKGTGKTAIAEYLLKYSEHDTFSEKLTFKNFPFKLLYDLDDSNFNSPNQYISLWKYIIYSYICRMFIRNESIDSQLKEKLKDLYGGDPQRPLSRLLPRWTAESFKVSALAFGASVKRTAPAASSEDWTHRVDALEEVILKYADRSRYYILFDELDEDYGEILDPRAQARYTPLLIGLFKAVQDIRATFTDQRYRIFPVVFLRDDIYEPLVDSDKNKWTDQLVNLDWDAAEIRRLLAFRIARATNPLADPPAFRVAWDRLFTSQASLSYIVDRTHLRPRDVVKYLQLCAKASLTIQGQRISSETVSSCSEAFSKYFRQELIDEMYPVLPDVSECLALLGQIRKTEFSIDEFREVFERELSAKRIKTNDWKYILQILFNFSVIGNVARAKNIGKIFRYQHKGASFNFGERVIVHLGLWDSLMVYARPHD